MANENFIGTGEGESPLMKPAAPNVDMRTMNSDMQSINTGGPARNLHSAGGTRKHGCNSSGSERFRSGPIVPNTPSGYNPRLADA